MPSVAHFNVIPRSLPRAVAVALLACTSAAVSAEAPYETPLQQEWERQRRQHNTLFSPPRTATGTAITVAPNVADRPVEPHVEDREQWRTPEFLAGGGLSLINADAAYARGLTGTGVRLGVLDSGTWFDHPEFAGKDNRAINLQEVNADGQLCQPGGAFAGPDACFTHDGREPTYEFVVIEDDVPAELRAQIESEYGPAGLNPAFHGTHVGGIIAANRDQQGMHGVAFGASLTAASNEFNGLRHFFMQDGTLHQRRLQSAEMPDELQSVQFESFFRDGTRAINNSWGAGMAPSTREELEDYLASPQLQWLAPIYADTSSRHGMVQVWAAGNVAAGTPPPERPSADALASLPHARPELEPLWLSVVAVDAQSELDGYSAKCGFTANWCVAAPGTAIDGPVVMATDAQPKVRVDGDNTYVDLPDDALRPDYRREGGTSMAAPHVTGALGLLFERFPYLDTTQVRDVLLTTATDLGEPGVDEIFGWGLINLEKAIEGYGQLRVDTDVVMNQHAGGRKVWQGDAWDDWTNDIGGPGALTKSGIGWLRLSGDNRFNGAVVHEGILELDGQNSLTADVRVEGGQLRLNGSLINTDLHVRAGSANVSRSGLLDGARLQIDGGEVLFDGLQRNAETHVAAGGRLVGTGTLGSTQVDGVLSPGNGIFPGTMHINGDYRQTSASTFLAQLANGRPELLAISGTASLDGTLMPVPVKGQRYLGEQFAVLSSGNGIDGQFSAVDSSAFSPFLTFNLHTEGAGVYVDVKRGVALESAATGANQRAVAKVLDTLPLDHGLPDPVTQLQPQYLGNALDALGGQLHAATPAVLSQNSHQVRDAVSARAAIAPLPPYQDDGQATVWLQAIGSAGRLGGDSGAADTRSNSSGLLAGAEHVVGNVRLGAVLGAGRSDALQVQAGRARMRSADRHAGVYVLHQWNALSLGGGIVQSWHDIRSDRDIQFDGFSDRPNAHQRGRTRQAFIEASGRFGNEAGALTPFMQVARVRVDVGDVDEQGASASLHGRVPRMNTTVAAVGLRFDQCLMTKWQENCWLSVNGAATLQQQSGDRAGVALLGFNTGDPFAVMSSALSRRSWIGDVGITAWLSPRQQVKLGYKGLFASRQTEQSLTASWSITF